jgi:hypothetical protein
MRLIPITEGSAERRRRSTGLSRAGVAVQRRHTGCVFGEPVVQIKPEPNQIRLRSLEP